MRLWSLTVLCLVFRVKDAKVEDLMLYRSLYRSFPAVLGALAVALFVSQSALAAEKTHEGKFVKAADGKLTMTDKDGSNKHTHSVAADATIRCDGKDVKLDELKEGYFITVTTNTDGNDKTMVTKIEAREKDSARGQRRQGESALGEGNDAVNVRVMVPTREAKVWFENEATRQQGTDRLYTSPPLEKGRAYYYTIKASWMENGREVTREQTVPVRAGQQVVANFNDLNENFAPGSRRGQTDVDLDRRRLRNEEDRDIDGAKDRLQDNRRQLDNSNRQDSGRQLDNANRTGRENTEAKGTTKPGSSKSGSTTPPAPKPPQ
jgi:uncharacterized protein (TIGR03000 family)